MPRIRSDLPSTIQGPAGPHTTQDCAPSPACLRLGEPTDALLRRGSCKAFAIRIADHDGLRSTQRVLVQHRPPRPRALPPELPWQRCDADITLTATQSGEAADTILATVGIGLESGEPLAAQQHFAPEIAALRQQGRKVCEFIKLGDEQLLCSRRVLASLFHVAYLYAFRLHHHHTAVVQATPRHVAFYCHMLGFEAVGNERIDPDTGAASVLLKLDFGDVSDVLEHLPGCLPLAARRSLYWDFFSLHEEAAILARILQEHARSR